jgi:hypothetical protein
VRNGEGGEEAELACLTIPSFTHFVVHLVAHFVEIVPKVDKVRD